MQGTRKFLFVLDYVADKLTVQEYQTVAKKNVIQVGEVCSIREVVRTDSDFIDESAKVAYKVIAAKLVAVAKESGRVTGRVLFVNFPKNMNPKDLGSELLGQVQAKAEGKYLANLIGVSCIVVPNKIDEAGILSGALEVLKRRDGGLSR